MPIQAFAFTHELSWLLLKDFLADQGVSGISRSRDAVREAVMRELLRPGSKTTWMTMTRSRNLTSHTDNPALAQDIAGLSIPGLPESANEAILQTLGAHPQVQRVVLYSSRALGRQRSGSDVDFCLFAPAMNLAELLELGALLDDLLLPWRIDLQLDHLISHQGLRSHIQRAGRVLLDRASPHGR